MLLKWLPWEFMIRYVARKKGFLDPIAIFARLSSISQPTSTMAPVELLRAGAVLHARGFLNNHIIQHNLDWVWPLWVERQFDPRHPAFIPRCFSMTHINLTQRTWTAVGFPGCMKTPIVDAAGLMMPYFDSWSLDAWIISDQSENIIPSKMKGMDQTLSLEGNLKVTTQASHHGLQYLSTVQVEIEGEDPVCRMKWRAQSDRPAWLVISLRPYNPEGISLVDKLSLLPNSMGWSINKSDFVYFDTQPDETQLSRYHDGDVFGAILRKELHKENSKVRQVECEVGMATGAALYRLEPGIARNIQVTVPLSHKPFQTAPPSFSVDEKWNSVLSPGSKLQTGKNLYSFLFEASMRTVVLLSPREVFAGPYTYKRFWYRDAAIIIHSMICLGHKELAENALDYCISKQSMNGYFKSQEGEWDSNGQVLWVLGRFCRLYNQKPKPEWIHPIQKAVKWIIQKLLKDEGKKPEAGLMPAGFSAEHLGPNDFYYWDDFWTIGGLRLAADMLTSVSETESGKLALDQANRLQASVDRSLAMVAKKLETQAMPASPYRRMDSGAIGSLAAGFPLQLWHGKDMRITATDDFLVSQCLVGDAFYHDISHSGINAYLSLHLAQCLLRSGDEKFSEVMDAVARLASPTGQWPEAIHPQLETGCMGDGQHTWAAAEWLMMIRNCFVFEEEYENKLILAAGISLDWLDAEGYLTFGPAPTRFGPVEIHLHSTKEKTDLTWVGKWFNEEPEIDIRLQVEGWEIIDTAAGRQSFRKKGNPL